MKTSSKILQTMERFVHLLLKYQSGEALRKTKKLNVIKDS